MKYCDIFSLPSACQKLKIDPSIYVVITILFLFLLISIRQLIFLGKKLEEEYNVTI